MHANIVLGGFGNFYTMKRSSKVVPALTSLYKSFMEDYLDILEKMEKLEELKSYERKLVRDNVTLEGEVKAVVTPFAGKNLKIPKKVP